MADSKENEEQDFAALAEEQRRIVLQEGDLDPVTLIERVYQLWWRWADFHIYVIKPTLPTFSPPKIILPEQTDDSEELEFVYPIHDYGYKLSMSKAEELFSAGLSMCKMYYTIEKMIYILIERLKEAGIETDSEVQVSFGGHELCQRKAFESIINLSYNVVVTNFDPGPWGEQYLQIVKRLADKGYGYPSEAPRDNFRHSHHAPTNPRR